MGIGVFTDKKVRPTDEQVRAAIGPLLAAWDALVGSIRATYPADEDFRFMYGKNYGWALRFRIRNQLLTSLYPTAGGFTVQINLGPEAVERTPGMGLRAHVQAAIDRAHPFPEGRWIFIPIASADDRTDIERLLALRVETKRLLKGVKDADER